ncbi:hypothetical protein SAMN03159453_00196 [Pseudomonas sp. NFIX28]|nr:hypothetical protein SAMN03159453_00196 [Pseudomonas sp. NFIX28]
MRVNLFPQRRDDTLSVVRDGSILTLNGEVFDFSRMSDGDTLPMNAFNDGWFMGDVDKKDGELSLTLILPLPYNYSQAQAFPLPLLNVPDGPVVLPQPLPSDQPEVEQEPWPARQGVIDWTKLITRAEKEAQAAADRLALAKAELSARNATAAAQIDRITDRVETLGYGIDAGEATAEDEAEQATLIVSMKAWKAYKFALGKVTTKEGWYDSPAWPVEPPIPEIVADPMLVADETT